MNKPVKTFSEEQIKFEAESEPVIRNFLNGWSDVGLRIGRIDDEELYRIHGFDSLVSYCSSKFALEKSQIYRLRDGAKLKAELPQIAAEKITSERQARALMKVDKKDRERIIDIASSGGQKLSAEKIETAIQKNETPVNIDRIHSPNGGKTTPSKPEKSAKIPQRKDAVGFSIPTKILNVWERAESESKGALTRISEVMSAVKEARESDDVIYGELSKRWQDLLINLENVKSDLKRVAPYAVCTNCQGQIPCRECFGKGFVSKMFWDESVPQEFKDLRKKSAEKAGKK